MPRRRDFEDEEIRKIRREAKWWPERVLANRYNVSMRTISLIVNRITYAHVA